MATLSIMYLKGEKKPYTTYVDYKLVKSVSVTGKKMPLSYTKKYFSKTTDDDILYFVNGKRKNNPYGSLWIGKFNDNWYVSQCHTDKEELCSLPYDKIVVKVF